MKSSILRISPQESFPSEDLSEDNTALLELLLQNNEIITNSHEMAEKTVFLYSASHMSVKALATYANPELLYQGMDLGATVYEATSSLVKPIPEAYDNISTIKAIRSISPPYVEQEDFLTTIVDAKDSITSDCPNLSHVITEVSRRYSSQFSDAALAGAGLVRNSELVAKSHFTH